MRIKNLLIGLIAFAVPAQGQEPATNEGDGQIVVEGLPWNEERELVENQVKALSQPVRTSDPMPRYFDPFCPATWNVSESFALVILDRVRKNAAEAGVNVAPEDCKPNALIAITSDVDGGFEQLREDFPIAFSELKRYEIDRAERGTSGVRAWNLAENEGRDGLALFSTRISGGGAIPDTADFAINRQNEASGRLNGNIRSALKMSVIMLDADLIAGNSLNQLADFATMRLLVQTYETDPDDDIRYSTILSLFSEPDSAPTELSPFDRAILKGAYALADTARDTQLYEAASSAYRERLLELQGSDGLTPENQ